MAASESKDEFPVHKIDQLIYDSDWFKNKPAEVQAFIRKWPISGFYVRGGTTPVRVYGHAETQDGKWRLHTAVPMMLWVSLTIGGSDPDEMVRVKEWSPEHIAYIKSRFPAPFMGKVSEAFLTPEGVISFLPDEADQG